MPKPKDLKKEILEKIQSGEVRMRPHHYFIFFSALLAGGVILGLLLAGFFTNLFFFRVRVGAPFTLLRFGSLGWGPFLGVFPWLPVILAILLFLAVFWLFKRLDIFYKNRLLVLGFFGLVLLGGLLLSFSRVNHRLQGVQVFHPFYQDNPVPVPGFPQRLNLVVGEVLSVRERELSVKNFRDEQIKVVWDETTRLPDGEDFAVGETVMALGQWQDESQAVLQAQILGRADRESFDGPYNYRPGVGYRDQSERMWIQ